ncbi:hypothetical protein RFI36_00485 [Acinetobacter gerneri]|uniref:Uncharacterized protein n=1 Tax=Acinetobacter gerneri TaxID=202952 RepID=A0AAW8JEL3_9GAMM|nr:hypothetical protein [Acinetobacter gerneri]MDQ9008223.1 hypothetical protein [Acinetobacter gerneri]MDQ9012363.1 hypothetical protein [Acinetobacter gerneri]MDQ9023762.1 hypothetical protein [Acinetobacter gerneri]MDQ9051276.1 hypothetical protein [Acinetobacter gerneri]MDQ9058865.1 hypothetical protein [Acinetobacter gerneri]
MNKFTLLSLLILTLFNSAYAALNDPAQNKEKITQEINLEKNISEDWLDYKILNFQYIKKQKENKAFIQKNKITDDEPEILTLVDQQLKSSRDFLLQEIQKSHPQTFEMKELFSVYRSFIDANYLLDLDFNHHLINQAHLKNLSELQNKVDYLANKIETKFLHYHLQNKLQNSSYLNDWLEYKITIQQISDDNKRDNQQRMLEKNTLNLEQIRLSINESSEKTVRRLSSLQPKTTEIHQLINLKIKDVLLLNQIVQNQSPNTEEQIELFELGNKIEDQEQLIEEKIINHLKQSEK